MAGNVAEWTATAEAGEGASAGAIVVKGGSYRDDAALLQPSASITVTAENAATWLGFRCAASTAQP